MRMQIEGSMAAAKAVQLCRPNVVCAYPITPQTHIVEDLAQMHADGEYKGEFVNVESEFSAASVVLGASAVGARTYTTTTSQGLLLMLEVLYNIAGLRLPVVLTCANRAISSPLSIWNDQQDSMTARDTGWIQIYAESGQEVFDLHIQAFKIAERAELPVMVCMDGFILTHAFEPVDVADQEAVDSFVPPYRPTRYLDGMNPTTMGAFAEPDKYYEARYAIQRGVEKAMPIVEEVANEFKSAFGRSSGGLLETYRTEDADVVVVALGSVLGTIKDAVDEMRAEGKKVGALKLITYRPFPKEALKKALAGVKTVAVLEKAFSMGYGGILTPEIKGVLYGESDTKIVEIVAGLGGRDITPGTIREIVKIAEAGQRGTNFVGLNLALVAEEDR
jgi:pyruvate ferredoxin oxidoreductase alpha subunit